MWPPVTLLPLLLLLCTTLDVTSSARILGLFPHFGKSHFDFFEPLMKTLARRGHEVVVVSHFPQTKPLANYTDISLRGCLPDYAPSVSAVSFTETLLAKRFGNTPSLGVLGAFVCNFGLSYPPVQELISSDQHFDLIIYELFNTDCFLGFAHKFKAPSIAASSCGIPFLDGERFGNPDNPSYIPILFEPSTVKMTFMERLFNTVHYIFIKTLSPVVFDWPAEWYARKYFGETLPPLWELQRNASLFFINHHFSINRPRPQVPGVIELAGLHISPVKKLPQEFQEFLDGAEHGVIYFSMGSLIKADTLSESRRQALVEAFAELPQRVLWKWDSDVLPGQPKNVKIAKWMPQFDILNHPNVKLYIGHGGQLGVIEAAHCGVPMIAIPMLGDQDSNIRHLELAGMAIRLSYWSLSKESVLGAIRTIVTDPSYKENAMKVSRAYHDRPMSAMDTAVYWTEYVIRHRGAPHLRSAAVDLNFFQYLLLDVIATVLAVAGIISFVIYKVIKRIFRAVFKRKVLKSKKKTN
ncbi:UDP-glycosyltransferase UGT5 [Anabrus simplex]|uniref:UDP-glycosyltransferase UGT5 n=1 Tax=Anabrus simplex TaxID=316456 RepID=UPI0035A29C75